MDEPGKQISSTSLTSQEHFFMGGGGELEDPYIPLGLPGIAGIPETRVPLEEIIADRKRFPRIQSERARLLLELPGPAIIALSELGPDGRPLKNPKILGFLDPETGELVIDEKRDLTREYIEKYKALEGTEIPMREEEPPQDISRS